MDTLMKSGDAQDDARVLALRSNRARSHEGATISLEASIESAVDDSGTVKLYENGIQVASFAVELTAGEILEVPFERTPEIRNTYRYRVALEGFTPMRSG